jgi:hypothetical protein
MNGTQHLEIRGLTIGGLWNVRPSTGNSWTPSSKPAADLVFSGLVAKTFLWRNVVGLTLSDSKIGGQNVSTSGLGVPKVGDYPAEGGAQGQPSNGVLIEGTLFADIIRTVTGSTHAECLYLDAGVDGVVVRNNVFTNCGVFDIFSNGNLAGRPITNILIEGNQLDIPRDLTGGAGSSAINFKGGAGKVTVRGNSILGNVRLDTAPYQWTSTANAIGGTGGSSSDVMAANPGFVSASRAACNLSACFRNDLHVLADSVAGRTGAGVPQQGSPNPSACSNGKDDDTDGKIDFAADPGCESALDPDETDPPPVPTCLLGPLVLTKVSEDATTVTFGWEPPAGADWYTFWINASENFEGTRVSNAPAVAKDGTAKRTIRFSKGQGCYRVRALGPLADGGAP